MAQVLPTTHKTFVLASFPHGEPQESDFRLEERTLPPLQDGQILVRTSYLSVDPYLRGRMRPERNGFAIGDAIVSRGLGEVIASKAEAFAVGEFVAGYFPWTDYSVHLATAVEKVPATRDHVLQLGVLGLTGLTAYFGLLHVGRPKAGQTLLVSGAAGATGSVVGQLGKIAGLRVVGIAGGPEKVKLVKELGFDEAVDYKATQDLASELKRACPGGIDVYFDNVGGTTLDAVVPLLNVRGVVVCCGAISIYNSVEKPQGPRHDGDIIYKRLRFEGFLAPDFAKDFPTAIREMEGWIAEGKLRQPVTLREGFENTPRAFIDMLKGVNVGKMLVKF